MLIVGFPCIGKTICAQKHPNVLDLESTRFHYCVDNTQELAKGKEYLLREREIWPHNYIDEIQRLQDKYDIIFVSFRKELLQLLYDNHIEFMVALPGKSQQRIYLKRAKDRGNSKEYIQGFRRRYNLWRNLLLNLEAKKILLKKNEFIENALIEQGLIGEKNETKIYR